MKQITGFFYDILDTGTEFLQGAPGFMWEHKMWMIAVVFPLIALYALYKFLWP